MGRFAVITLTDAAANRVHEIMTSREDALGIRVGVKKGGCAGMEYTIELATEAKAGDDLIEKDGAKVFIAPEAVLFFWERRWILKSQRCARGLSSTTPTRPPPAAVANPSS